MGIWSRASVLLAVSIVCAYGLLLAALNLTSWGLEDADAYWDAAMRLRIGESLYPALTDEHAPDVFRYAPWFAWAWVPLTYLPRPLVDAAWSVALLAGCVACVLPALRTRTPEGLALAVLCGGLLVRAASTGNVQPLMLAAMMFAPGGFAIAASMKVVPLLGLLPDLFDRRWRRLLIGLGITGLLVAPMLLYDLSHYPTSGTTREYPLYLAISFGGVLVAWRSKRYRWLGIAVAMMFALPRQYPYGMAYLLIAARR